MCRTLAKCMAIAAAVSCGYDPASTTIDVPAWAKVAPEQIAEGEKHGVRVAFENDLGMRFVLIPAGTFLMGSPEDEEGRNDDETQHRVTISHPFYMQVTEVTNAQFRRFHPQHDSGTRLDLTLNNDDQPAVNLRWMRARDFAAFLSEEDGEREYRLPTEAEWEYACRAGSVTRYSWGGEQEDAHEYANALDSPTKRKFNLSGRAFLNDDGHLVAAPVARFAANAWSLHDMSGNVHEWCDDWYGPYSGVAVVDPHVKAGHRDIVIRGGCALCGPSVLRPAWRGSSDIEFALPDVGFRLISTLSE